MQWYYQHEPPFNGVYSGNNLPKNVNNEAHAINLHFYDDIEAHWVAFYVKNDEEMYCKSFGIEHILKEVQKFRGDKNTIPNIYRIQADDSIMCGHFHGRFIDFIWRYYATFKVRKFESLYEINTCLQKTTSCNGLRTEQTFTVNI